MGNGDVILDRGSDSSSNDDDDPPYSVNYSHNADDVQPEEAVIIEMEAAVVKLVCMMCLHDYINSNTKAFPGASQVTMYMGRDLPTVIEFRAPGINSMYQPAPANHIYHRKRERAEVRNEGHMDPSEDEMDAENVQGDANLEDGDEPEIVVHNRKRVRSDITDDEESGDEMQENEVEAEQQNQGVVEQDNQVGAEQQNQGDAGQENQDDAGQENQVDAEPENE